MNHESWQLCALQNEENEPNDDFILLCWAYGIMEWVYICMCVCVCALSRPIDHVLCCLHCGMLRQLLLLLFWQPKRKYWQIYFRFRFSVEHLHWLVHGDGVGGCYINNIKSNHIFIVFHANNLPFSTHLWCPTHHMSINCRRIWLCRCACLFIHISNSLRYCTDTIYAGELWERETREWERERDRQREIEGQKEGEEGGNWAHTENRTDYKFYLANHEKRVAAEDANNNSTKCGIGKEHWR